MTGCTAPWLASQGDRGSCAEFLRVVEEDEDMILIERDISRHCRDGSTCARR
jgi:hypothetical protein